jgi:hypothetical protein
MRLEVYLQLSHLLNQNRIFKIFKNCTFMLEDNVFLTYPPYVGDASICHLKIFLTFYFKKISTESFMIYKFGKTLSLCRIKCFYVSNISALLIMVKNNSYLYMYIYIYLEHLYFPQLYILYICT